MGCFSAANEPNLAIIESKLDSTRYCTILESVLLLFVEDKNPNGWRFQQDNASMHTSNYTKQFFADTDVEVLEWPARSTDLKPIQKQCGYLVMIVDSNFRQFDNSESLIEAVAPACDSIDLKLLR